MRIVTVVGTRPEVIRLSRVMPALDKAVDHKIIHTGQNYDYELNEIFFKEMGLRSPDIQLDSARWSAVTTTANIMYLLESRLTELKPDAVLILGDTNSCFAAAYVSKRLKIPLFHMESGNRCFDQRVPEEINRGVVDRLADINMPYSALARENLIREGFAPDRIIVTGSPLNEVYHHYGDDINRADVLTRLGLEYRNYFVVSSHREENIEKFGIPWEIFETLAKTYNKRVIVPMHPRVSESGEHNFTVSPLVSFHKPFGFFDYTKLEENAYCVLSDSGTISEESSMLGFPALNIRESHERPEAMEEASAIMTGFNVERIRDGVWLSQTRTIVPTDYITRNVSDKVVRIILSYTDYVTRNVWRR